MGEFGVFVASSTELDDFDAIDVSLAKVLAANAEEALQRTERDRQLRERARQLRTVVENVPMVLFAFDDEGVFTLTEGKALAQLGSRPGANVGNSVFDVYGHHDEIVANCRSALDGETVRSTVSVDALVFETWYRPILEDGEVKQVIGTAVDVTQRDRRERLLRVLNRFLRHNLRNAITVILGNAETTVDHTDPEVRDAAEEVIDAGIRLDRLTTKARRLIQLIDIEENPATVPLADALEWMVDDIERAHDVTVTMAPPDEAVGIEEFVVSVGLHELLENAVEHGATPVELTASIEGETAVVHISDEGTGLPEHDRSVLTDADETPLNHGSGLGLFVASWVVSHADGEVEIEESGPDGTTIRISIPVTDQQDGDTSM
jgi:PAS domain S-box-containing protein